MKLYRTGSGEILKDEEEWKIFRSAVYEYIFYNDNTWMSRGPTAFFNGQLIHYSDFMKAKRGQL